MKLLACVQTEERTIEVVTEEKIPLTRFYFQQFMDYEGPPDPAGLCDGGDYCNSLQFRLEEDLETMFVSWQPGDHSSGLRTFTMPYDEFFAAIVPALKAIKAQVDPDERDDDA